MKRRPDGFTILELLVSAGVFALVTTLLVALFTQSLQIWRRTSGRDGAARELRRARAALERDLSLASPDQLRRANVPAHLAAPDGEALWFLSPIDPATRQIARGPDGMALWQRNVLYYLVVPANHGPCTGGPGPDGLDDRCPHKLLVRKVINQDTLLPDVSAYLTQPVGFSLAGMAGEANLEEASIVANGLLTFRTESAPAPHAVPNLLRLDLRAVAVEDARHQVALGTTSLFTSPYTLQSPFTVLLRNL